MKIIVDPARLEQTAAVIDRKTQEYEQCYRQLFQDIDQMQSVWKGRDNQAYTIAIKDFYHDFQKMSALMNQYAGFLKMSAKAYRNTQEERMQQAKAMMR